MHRREQDNSMGRSWCKRRCMQARTKSKPFNSNVRGNAGSETGSTLYHKLKHIGGYF